MTFQNLKLKDLPLAPRNNMHVPYYRLGNQRNKKGHELMVNRAMSACAYISGQGHVELP